MTEVPWVGFEPTIASAFLQLADSTSLPMPNLPPMPPTIARYCTLALQAMSGKDLRHDCEKGSIFQSDRG
jgi:hypothetical protein